jgi:hypothetical protein
MRTHARLITVLILVMGAITGCSTYSSNPVSPNAPFFSPDPQDVKLHQMDRQKADQLLSTCAGTAPCERARFLRGMVALYEDRELAATHFKAALAAAPGTHVGSSSQFWLQLLKESDSASGQASFAQATARLVRELLDQELLLRQAISATTATDLTVLKQELKIRDKQVEDLTKQLEALKQIDREMRDMAVPTRPASKPAPSLKPNEGP